MSYPKEMKIDEVVYVKKDEMDELSDNYYIIRTNSAGVHAGEIVSREGKEVKLKNARRLYYWDGAATLSQLAMEGVEKPENCKFPCEVNEIILTEAIEIMPCTIQAQKSIKNVKVWEV